MSAHQVEDKIALSSEFVFTLVTFMKYDMITLSSEFVFTLVTFMNYVNI